MSYADIYQSGLDKDFVIRLSYAISEDILVWGSPLSEKVCQYTAILGDVTFELNCDPTNQYLVIDGKKYFIGAKASNMLCQLILSQRTRRPNREGKAKIAKITEMFDKISADRDMEQLNEEEKS
jgi:hypothetical protein